MPTYFTAPQDVGHHIHGEVITPSGSRMAPITNPATGQVTRHVALASRPSRIPGLVRDTAHQPCPRDAALPGLAQ